MTEAGRWRDHRLDGAPPRGSFNRTVTAPSLGAGTACGATAHIPPGVPAGTGTVRDGGTRVPLDVKADDVILFGRYTSPEVKLDGEEYLIMREDEVPAVIETG